MTGDSSLKADTIALQAFELPPEQWSEYVRNTCAGDEALQRETEAILAKAHVFPLRPDEKLQATIEHVVREWRSELDYVAEGARLGAYEIVRELGRGGMGAVYLAKRADQEYEGLCAIKVIRQDARYFPFAFNLDIARPIFKCTPYCAVIGCNLVVVGWLGRATADPGQCD